MSQDFRTSFIFEECCPNIADFVPSIMIEELRHRDLSAHVEIGSISKKCGIFFTNGQNDVAELGEIEFTIVVDIMPSK